MIRLKKDNSILATLDRDLRWSGRDQHLIDTLNRATEVFRSELRPSQGDPLLYVARQCVHHLKLDAEISDQRAEGRDRIY